jgi:hypothetical protein
MRYVISYDLIAPGKNYQALYDALATINAKKILLSQWVANRASTTPAGLRDYLWQFMDANDRLLVTELEGPGWASQNTMVIPNTV